MIIENGKLIKVNKEDVLGGIVTIPFDVTEIESDAFSGLINIERITLSNISKIPSKLFMNFQLLKTIYLPDSLTEIESEAFKNCTNLEMIIIPKNVKTIGNEAFCNCSKLSSVILPTNIKQIKDKTFLGCTKLKSINIPNSVTSIGKEAFSNCSNLSSIILSSKLETIGSNAFLECNSLKQINLPESLTQIDEGAFSRTALSSIIIPKDVKVIDTKTFFQCIELEKVELPKNLYTIKSMAFSGCIKLQNITLPENLLYIGSGAFSSCEKLNEINLPNSVETLNGNAFKNCSNLTTVTLPKNLDIISNGLFSNCVKLEKISLPNKIKTIDSLAFAKCYMLKDVKLNNGLETISTSSFYACSNLKNINLPNSLKTIHSQAFLGCKNLEEIVIPNKIENIDFSTFENCRSLKFVKLPSSLESINYSAFKNCSAIKEINLPNSVFDIKDHAFENCSNLKNVKLPDHLNKIKVAVFQDCTALEEIQIPESVEVIEDSAFCGCKSLSTINIPENISIIEDFAFENCPTLGIVEFPNSLKKMGEIGEDSFMFFEKIENRGFRLSTTQLPDTMPISNIKNINPALLSRHWEYKNLLLKEQQNALIGNFYNKFISYLSWNMVNNFLEFHNFTFFKQLQKYDKGIKNNLGFYKLLFNLGGFLPPLDDNGKEVNYAQKVIGFFIEKIDKKQFDPGKYYNSFKTMESNGFKKEFTEFFINNFDEIMKAQKTNNEFIEKCYNNFEEVQKTNTSNKGSQRQLKPTVKKFIEYFKENKFMGITEESKKIANEIGKFTSKQESFENAVEIDKERQANNVPNNLVGYHLTENSYFSNFQKYSKDINNSQIKIVDNLANIATNEFSFDWLEKNDPQNFILGKLCSCCAHVEGVGYGIMKASIINPNVQTLVIRDENSEIIAKATLYVNPKQHYGVFNNVEVRETLPASSHKKIYKKFILGVQVFAQEYNKTHPKNQLKQINVGMEINDIDEQIALNHKKSSKLFVALDYSKYCKDDDGYNGDSSFSQYIVWQAPTKRNEQ